MIIEWLKFKVAPAHRETLIQKDNEIWTPFLQDCPGFIHKEVWIHPDELSEVVIVIHWATLEQEEAIPKEKLIEIEQKFLAAISPISYQLLDVKFYQLRKSAIS